MSREYPIQTLVLQTLEFMPAKKEPGILYHSPRFELAIHLCACGCGGESVTPLEPVTGWVLTTSPAGPTMVPSIGHTKWPCGSHYHITDGRIVPCD